ncbi:hypothetical protein [Pikeienuella sp. HZG-20]|uniref:hypothetical protein n=1 Tax=Paludibacillus litoralis TaxID=3133267 RepID=UPI0030EC10F3
MAVTADRQYRQRLTASLANYQSQIQDLVFGSNPVSKILRERGMFKTFTGPEIRQPLTIDKFEGQWFTAYDTLANSPKEILNTAFFTPKNLAVGFSLSGAEMRENDGRPLTGARIEELPPTDAVPIARRRIKQVVQARAAA